MTIFVMPAVVWTAAVAVPTLHQCTFCGDPTTSERTKHAWYVCPSKYCMAAAKAQTERMYAGLFDTVETRASALAWVKSSG